jgi:DNA/RNA endonuclease YhcR with UshA esterase domain
MKLNLLVGTLCVSLILSAAFAEALTTAEIVLAQTSTITADQAPQYIGQNATVEGVVVAVSTSKRGNTFINFGGVYPNQTFTGWVPAGTPLASDSSMHLLQGKKIKITGLIELYRGKPEIRILSRDQITEE